MATTTTTRLSPTTRPRLGGLWRNPDYRKLWGAQSVSIFGFCSGNGSKIEGKDMPFGQDCLENVALALLIEGKFVPATLRGIDDHVQISGFAVLWR